MAGGRCSGCGLTNNSCKVVKNHVRTCADYLKLYRENPDACLTPEQELARFKLEEGSKEAKQAGKGARIETNRAAASRRRLSQQSRWSEKTS